jgi:hypothetical protein
MNLLLSLFLRNIQTENSSICLTFTEIRKNKESGNYFKINFEEKAFQDADWFLLVLSGDPFRLNVQFLVLMSV